MKINPNGNDNNKCKKQQTKEALKIKEFFSEKKGDVMSPRLYLFLLAAMFLYSDNSVISKPYAPSRTRWSSLSGVQLAGGIVPAH